MFAAPQMLLFALLAGEDVAAYEKPFHAGLISLQQSQLATAEANLQTAIRLAPKNGRVWVALTQTYWRLHDSRKAEFAAEKARQFASGDPVVLESLLIYYSESKQTLKAAEIQVKYNAAKPGVPHGAERAASLYFEAAEQLLQSGKFTDGIEVLRRAKTTLGGDPQIDLALGVAYYGLRRFDEAAVQFLAVISASPNIEQPYLFLGRMLDQIPAQLPEVTGRFIEYEKANPELYLGYLLHAKALNAQAIEPEETRRLLEKSISMNGRDASAHFELGILLERMKLLGEAGQELERAAELESADPATHYHLARIYDRVGNHEAAAAERERHANLIRIQNSTR